MGFQAVVRGSVLRSRTVGSGVKGEETGGLRPGRSSWQRRQWHPTPVPLPGKSHGLEEPGRLQSMGSRRGGHN